MAYVIEGFFIVKTSSLLSRSGNQFRNQGSVKPCISRGKRLIPCLGELGVPHDKFHFYTIFKSQHLNNSPLIKLTESISESIFRFEGSKELNSNIKDLVESLLNKIVNKGWHDNHRDFQGNPYTVEDDYNCFQSNQIDSKTIESVESYTNWYNRINLLKGVKNVFK